ncbi:MAG: metallophosphoesterase [archaeon]
MYIIDGIKIADLGIYIEKEKTLILSDFHMGYEEALSKQGVFIPRHQFSDTTKRLERMISKLPEIKTTIITGDLKHEFGTISQQEWRDVFGIIELLQKHCEKLVILRGNHDTVLQSMLNQKKIDVKTEFCFGDFAVLHGDAIPSDVNVLKRKTFIIGHAHPAIKLTDSFTSEKVKCFLKGRWGSKTLVVLPSYNLVTEGSDILTENILSPFLQKDIGSFEVWAVAGSEKAMYFGTVSKILKATG